MKEPPSMFETLYSLALGVSAFAALLVVQWGLKTYREAAREHPRGCICPRDRRRVRPSRSRAERATG